MPKSGSYYVILIAEKDNNSYNFYDDRETAETAFKNVRHSNKTAVAITFGELTIIDTDNRQK
jgi:hypothetical protein